MIEPGHRRAIRAETIVSVAINALIPTAIIWAIGVSPPKTLGGVGGLLQSMGMASGLATTAMTAIVTLLVRGRLRAAKVPPLSRARLPAIVRLLPTPLPLRAVTMGIVAAAILVPIGAAIAAAASILPLTVGGLVLFNLVFGAIVGLTMTPGVVLRALADPVRAG